MGEPRVIIVGAGPAGVRAAEAMVAAGLRPVVIDEGANDGGQIYRRQPSGFTRTYETLYGTQAVRAAALHRAFEALRARVDFRPRTLAWNVWERELHVVFGAKSQRLPFDALILATGATDRLMPIKGWDLAGTFSLGGAQIALKAQACAIGRSVAFVGTGPLLYLVAKQYLAAGVDVRGVLDASPFSARLVALPKLMSRPATAWQGLALVTGLRRAGIRMETGIAPLEIFGTPEDGVTGFSWHDASGEVRHLECDAVALGYHIRPEVQLADLARCAFAFDTLSRQWLPVADHEGRSTTAGVYLAGDGARVRGADAAEVSGRLAALAALADLGRATSASERKRLTAALSGFDRFSRGLTVAFPWPAHLAKGLPDDAIVCRCECVTAGELRQACRQHGAAEVNRAKAFSRVGMGRCQGRYCANAAAEVIATETGLTVEAVGRLRGQAPVKPIPMLTEDVTE